MSSNKADRPTPENPEEITQAMIEAGVEAFDYEDYEFGWSEEEEIVRRVYAAMRKVALSPVQPTTCAEPPDGRKPP